MLTLRSATYTESDLIYLRSVIEQGECKYPGHALCDYCAGIRACQDLQRLKAHIQKLLIERSFSEK